MRIIIIRHGEPDNPNQTLTKKGFEEVAALHDFYKDYPFDEIYVSPLARAQLTAKGLLPNRVKEFHTMDWLKEFTHFVKVPYSDERVQNWDFLPKYFTDQKDFYSYDKYLDHEVMKSGDIKDDYKHVVNEFDKILAAHGYVREGKYYRVIKENRDTLLFVCHFGMMSVLMAHLMSLPYVVLTQYFCCPPTGVTTLISEERVEGEAQFRCLGYGDISHLNIKGIKPSFHGRFCEIFHSDERH